MMAVREVGPGAAVTRRFAAVQVAVAVRTACGGRGGNGGTVKAEEEVVRARGVVSSHSHGGFLPVRKRGRRRRSDQS